MLLLAALAETWKRGLVWDHCLWLTMACCLFMDFRVRKLLRVFCRSRDLALAFRRVKAAFYSSIPRLCHCAQTNHNLSLHSRQEQLHQCFSPTHGIPPTEIPSLTTNTSPSLSSPAIGMAFIPAKPIYLPVYFLHSVSETHGLRWCSLLKGSEASARWTEIRSVSKQF